MKSKEERAAYPVITSLCSLHSLDRSEMFMELYREEKREEGDRGGHEDTHHFMANRWGNSGNSG